MEVSPQIYERRAEGDQDMDMDEPTEHTFSSQVILERTAQRPWMRLGEEYAPPTPRTPGEGVEEAGAELRVGRCEVESGEEMTEGLWGGGMRERKKNVDGRVKGFRMGYLAECERCKRREKGHFGHFVMAG